MNREHLKDLIDEIIYESVIGKNPFKVGDLVQLRPDVLKRHDNWKNTLSRLVDKIGKITDVLSNDKLVTVKFPVSWQTTDKSGQPQTVNSIGIEYTELIPSDSKIAEGVGYVSDKDMAKDPKHIKGERWRIKFQSASDLEKHGNTEKSKVNESAKELVSCDVCQGSGKNKSAKRNGQPCLGCNGSGKITGEQLKNREALMKILRPDFEKFLSGQKKNENVPVNEVKDVIQELIKEMWIGFEEEEEGKTNEARKDPYGQISFRVPSKDLELPGQDINPDDLDPNDPIGQLFRTLSQHPIYGKGIKSGSIRLRNLQKAANKLAKKKNLKKKVDEGKIAGNYIILAKSGPATVYYVDTPVGLGKMAQNAESYAKQFTSEQDVRNKLADLRGKYVHLTDWDVKIVEPNTGITKWDRSLLSQIEKPVHQVFRPVKKDGEYIVRWTVNGKTDESKSYYTDDKDDANSTYLMMVRTAEGMNKKS